MEDRPSHVENNLLKGGVTALTGAGSGFRLAMPSLRTTQEPLDDVCIDIPADAISAVLKELNSETLSIGTLWFVDDSLFPVEDNDTLLLNNRTVAIEVDHEVENLSSCFRITFFQQNASLRNFTQKCVFWDVRNDFTAYWSSSGCETEMRDGRVVCCCNHLSVFAVLLSPVNVTLSRSSVWKLTLLSQIGCSISIFFLSLGLCVFVFYRRRTSNPDNSFSIHAHLSVAQLFLNIIFLLSDPLTQLHVHALCVVVAALTHFSLLSTLTWFAMEGLHLYLLVIKVFNIHYRRYLLKLSLTAWALLIKLFKARAFRSPSEERSRLLGKLLSLLGLSSLLGVSWGAVIFQFGPLQEALMYVFCISNSLNALLIKLFKARAFRSPSEERSRLLGKLLSLLGLSSLLGVSWGAVIFQFGPLQEALMYVFCISNSLNGFFLCFRFVLLIKTLKKDGSTITISTNSTPGAPSSSPR
ncbi:adhesion G protein-coupled receptor G3-like [Chanos chanos]|uniref:Adhesion G protein-coupled receptor G3-like n=1 Tax=Chanos chanos TaxID=29144 RepID=A0A6J2VMW2_CHACN|nr:adhesion G protein-coupled receptor G3-like [Chanos chanos]